MAKIAIADKNIHPAAIAYLKDRGHEVGVPLHEADAGLIRSRVPDLAELGDNFLAFGRCGTGWNNLAHLTAHGVCILTAAGANAPDVADQVVHILLDHSRNISAARKYTHELCFGREQNLFRDTFEEKKVGFRGRRLKGLKLAIVGAGNVGMQVIERVRCPWIDMRVSAFDIAWLAKNRKRADELGVHIAASMEEALAGADYVTFHVPEDETTHGLIRANAIAMMKPRAVVLNLAREGVCNVDDMLRALNSEHVGHYFTDLPDVRFGMHPSATLTCHIGGETGEAQTATATLAAERLHRFLTRHITEGSVNFPMIDELPVNGAKAQLCIPHRASEKGVIASVTTLLSREGFNIEEEALRHKGDLGVSVMGVDKIVPPKVVDAIRKLPHVHRVGVCTL